jgi:hypothetical protein
MSETPIFDKWAEEFFADRGFRVETLYAPEPEIPPIPLGRKNAPKPGAVRKSMKGARPVGIIVDEVHEVPDMIRIDPRTTDWLPASATDEKDPEKVSDSSRLATFPEVQTLFDKRLKAPYRIDREPYTGEDTQPIDVTLLRTTKTLQPLE